MFFRGLYELTAQRFLLENIYIPLQSALVFRLLFTIKKVIMKGITEQNKRLKNFSLCKNGWTRITVNDH